MKYLFILMLAFFVNSSFSNSAEAAKKVAVKKNRTPASLDLSCQGALMDYYPCISASISRKENEVQNKPAEAAALERLNNAFNDLKNRKRLPEESAQVLNTFCQMMLNVDDFVSSQQ